MSVEQLTDLKLRKLKPSPSGRRDIWDAKVPGFGVRVASSGTKTFILMFRLDDRKRRMTLGRYPDMTLAEARGIAMQRRAEVSRGEDPTQTRRGRTTRFEAALDDFLKLHCERHNKPSTARSTRRLLEKECLPAWRGKAVKRVTRADVLAILDAMVARGSAGAANNAYAAMSKFFNWCVSRDIIDSSPCAGVARPTRLTSRSRVLADDELVAVWHAAGNSGYPFGHVVQLLLLTGQRRGEVATMEWAHIDWGSSVWNIPPENTKNGEAHVVPLSGRTQEVLKSVPRINERYVFPARGSKATCFSGFGKCKERLDEAIDRERIVQDQPALAAWCLHDLRRTCATGLAGLGVAPHVVERVLNHKSGVLAGVAGVYNRFQYLNEMRDGLNVWAAHVENIV